MADSVNVPKLGEWPGAVESFRTVKERVKPRIWDFITVVGIGIVAILVIEIILAIIFKKGITTTVLDEVFSIIIAALLQATIVSMYFNVLYGKDFTVNSALSYGYGRFLKMIGLIIVMYVLIVVSFALLVVPFFFVLPRIYLAPYYLIKNDSSVGEAIAASWHSTKGNASKVWMVLLLNLAIALLFITIVGIPLAIYWGIINSASFAYLTLYLSQPKPKAVES